MLCLFGIQLQAQQMTYHDASCFPLLGKATQDTGARYERLPDSLKNISRPPLWNLSRNSAGMAIRFRSNSTRIALKWENLFNNHMNHMTDVGIKGLDLYCWEENGQWRFVNSARPNGKQIKLPLSPICSLKKGNICYIFLFMTDLCHCL